MFPAIATDLRHAWRALWRQPAFVVAAVATLGLGLGANITIFSVVDAMLLRPLPFGDRSDRVVTLHATHRLLPRDFSFGDTEISYRDLLDLRKAGSFEGVGGYLTRSFTLSGDEASAERVRGGSVTPDLFPLLRVEPVLGRQFLPEEAAAPGLESVVMLTDGLWRRRYGADPNIVGRAIIVNGQARTVVGVLPPRFRFPESDELYVPFRWDESPRSARNVNGVAVLRPGVPIEIAREEAGGIARRLEAEYPETNRGFGVEVLRFRDTQVSAGARSTLAVIMLAVVFVLLIVCANLANLMLVRGAARQRETAVRAALGAGAGRLITGMLAEGIVLSALGVSVALLASQWALDALRTAWPNEVPYWVHFEMDGRIVWFTAAAAAFTAVALGIAPALRAARPDLAVDLKEASRGSSLGRAGQRFQAGLAVAQVALCLALLVGANLMVRSFLSLESADLGFDDRPMLTAQGYLSGDQYDDVRARAAFYQRVTETLRGLPGVVAAAATTALPGDDGGSPVRIVVDGRTTDDDEVGVEAVAVTSGVFDAMGLRMVDGRAFTDAEVADPDVRIALVNRGLANRLWPGESAIDHRVGVRRGNDGIDWFRVVGVAPDVHYEEVGEETEQSQLIVYVPYALDPSRQMALLVRASGDPSALARPMRDALGRLSATFPLFRVRTMAEVRRLSNWEQQFFGLLMGGFAGAALLVACLGVYGLIAYSVGRRAREIGVRLALGASPRDITSMLLAQHGRVSLAGIGIGSLLGLGLAVGLRNVLYGVAVDGWLIATMAAPLMGVVLLASWLPSRRAARMSPTAALREE